ncbi:MAG: endonuclease MutS2 [Bdellovibrionota bacterium]
MTGFDFQSLEWQSLLRHYSAHCLSAPAKDAALTLEPATEVENARGRLALTAEATLALENEAFAFLSGLETLHPILERLLRSSVLDGRDLLLLARAASISGDLRKVLSGEAASARMPRLHALAQSIPQLSAKAEPILRAIDEHGQVRDSASPVLRSLRDQERKYHSEARERVDNILQAAFRDGHLQDKFFDFRDGRYLIPVKSEFKNRVDGFVVESSATRATVFMEPAALRGINDKIKQAQLLIEEEIYRILVELSQKLHPHAQEFVAAYELTVDLDLTLARASFARAYGSLLGVSRPEFGDHFLLEELYHPLLAFVIDPDKVIRNDFRLGPQRRVLVISGPNTGGKTVLLKAVGLCSLMARCGFYLPCAGKAVLPFFENVLAQIGDSQNLELSLSSFSGSVRHLREMLESASRGSLVLVDEILHATDPDEATALSRAILSELQNRGAFAIVTTHLNGLKSAGEGDFESASMEFDPHLLSPTYRLRIGVPGSSRALEIAQKLGLEPAIVERARGFLSKEKVAEQSAVDQLEGRERELQDAKNELLKVKATLENEREQFARLNQELEQHKKRFRAEALEKIREPQREALGQVERLISEYKKKLASVDQKHTAALEAQAQTESVRESFKKIERALDEVAPPPPMPIVVPLRAEPVAPQFQINQSVRVLSMGNEGVLLSDPANRAKPAEVMVGIMRIKVPWDQLEPKAAGAPKAGTKQVHLTREDTSLPTEIHLLGKTVEEAIDALSSYMDRASRSGRPFVRIVHGHGSGALRKAVREFLKKSRYEMKFRAGAANEGGEGCTVVEFV